MTVKDMCYFSKGLGRDELPGTLSQAIDILKGGASDYVLKANPARLPSAVARSLREAEDRRIVGYIDGLTEQQLAGTIRYRRVVLKLSGQSLEGDQQYGIDPLTVDYLAEQLQRIVGIELRITRLVGKRKLNQHHEMRDREGAIRALEARGQSGLAEAMQRTLP
mgnify:CR=1 FL=1